EGGEYVSFVCPGLTAFPDFSLAEVRDWWAEQTVDFMRQGFGAFWIDMNDPSTGSSPHEDMLFARGSLPHGAYHNQYALGMAEATRRGVLEARPDERPY